jgi:nicotinamide mononucleotide (NMN) deamidase PncC
MKLAERVINILRKRSWYIGVMESCTGGAIIDSITNIPGASDVFKTGKVTYSDEAKIEAGVDKKVIDRCSVYSLDIAKNMAKVIGGEVGIGVTGHLPGEVFVAVRIKDKIISEKIKVKEPTSLKLRRVDARIEMKREVVDRVWKMVMKELG